MKYRKKPVVIEAWPWGQVPMGMPSGVIRSANHRAGDMDHCETCGEFMSLHAEVWTGED